MRLLAAPGSSNHRERNNKEDLPLWSYPLVNIQKTMERSTMFNGKIHYKWSFSIAMLNYQRVKTYAEQHRFLPLWVQEPLLSPHCSIFSGTKNIVHPIPRPHPNMAFSREERKLRWAETGETGAFIPSLEAKETLGALKFVKKLSAWGRRPNMATLCCVRQPIKVQKNPWGYMVNMWLIYS